MLHARRAGVLLSMLIALIVSAIELYAQPPQRQADSLLQRIDLLRIENPALARAALLHLEQLSAQSPQPLFELQHLRGQAAMAIAYGLYAEAAAYIDSAMVQSSANDTIAMLLLVQKLELCHATRRPDEVTRPLLAAMDKLAAARPSLLGYALRAQLAHAANHPDVDEATRMMTTTLKRAKASDNALLLAQCQIDMGAALLGHDDNKRSLALHAEALATLKRVQPPRVLLATYRGMGQAYRGLGQYDSAFVCYQRALDLAIGLSDRASQADLLNKLGALNLAFSRPDDALRYFERSCTIYEAEQMLRSTALVQTNIARAYARKQDYGHAMGFLQEALRAQEQLADPRAEAEILNEMGNVRLHGGSPEEALMYYLKSLVIRTNIGDKLLVARSSVNIGIAYRDQDMPSHAIRYLEQAVELMDDGRAKPAERVYALQNLAIACNQQGDHGRAVELYRRALTFANYMGDELQAARLLRNVAQAQRENGQLRDAQASLTHALKLAQVQHSAADIASIYNEQGNVEKQLRSYQRAVVLFQQAADTYGSIDNAWGQAMCLRKMGEVLTSMGRYAEAEQRIASSIEMGKQLANAQLLLYGHLAMYELFNAMGRFEPALRSHVRYARIRDSLEQLGQSRREGRMAAHTSIALNQKDAEIRAMEVELENVKIRSELDREKLSRQRHERKSLIIITSIVALLAMLVLLALVQKRRYARRLEEHIVEVNLMNNRLNQSEQELRSTLQAKDKLFSVVAHDLRSPVSALVELSGLMAAQADGQPRAQLVECSQLVNEAAGNVLMLVENLLHWTRSQTGRLTLHPAELDLGQLLDDALRPAHTSARVKGLNLSARFEPQLTLRADPDTITAVLRNLVSNAIKFTPSGGSVTVAAQRQPHGGVLIEVADTGVGIAPEHLPRLFGLGMGSTRGTNNEAGTGLGLLVCKEFVERNRGTMEVRSELGHGTTFSIEFYNPE